MESSFKVGLVQMNPVRGDRAGNHERILKGIREAAEQGVDLVVFPECALSGYVFQSVEEAMPAAETVPGETSESVLDACREHNVHAVVGLLERDGDQLYNSAMVCGPQGLIACYRKTHLPVLGIDRYIGRGQELPLLDLPLGRIGILICYDLRFPEAARLLTLRGADAIVLPTNWPEGADSSPNFLTRARAFENRIYILACDRVGVEEGTRFIGRSQIVAPDGALIAEADAESETLLTADVYPHLARQKKLILIPGVFELDPVGGRRPDLYGNLLPEMKD